MSAPGDRRSGRGVSRVEQVISALEDAFGTPVLPKKRARPLDMLVATILSQNTNVINSHRAYTELRKRYPTWEQVRRARTASIASAIRTGGMANQKSARIKELLKSLRDRFGTLDLRSLEKKTNEEIVEILLPLDGVGPKTVSCVMLFSLGRDVFPVDTHVHRICGRLGFSAGCKTPEQTFETMTGCLPAGKAYSFHINLIKLGRAICRASQPACHSCPLIALCAYQHKNMLEKGSNARPLSEWHRFMLLDHV